MAIKKPKNPTNFLGSTHVESLKVDGAVPQEVVSQSDVKTEEKSVSVTSEKTAKKKKDINNWGRPRKELIEGDVEVNTLVQLPKSLIKELKKVAKKENKSMKIVIGEALIKEYMSNGK